MEYPNLIFFLLKIFEELAYFPYFLHNMYYEFSLENFFGIGKDFSQVPLVSEEEKHTKSQIITRNSQIYCTYASVTCCPQDIFAAACEHAKLNLKGKDLNLRLTGLSPETKNRAERAKSIHTRTYSTIFPIFPPIANVNSQQQQQQHTGNALRMAPLCLSAKGLAPLLAICIELKDTSGHFPSIREVALRNPWACIDSCVCLCVCV